MGSGEEGAAPRARGLIRPSNPLERWRGTLLPTATTPSVRSAALVVSATSHSFVGRVLHVGRAVQRHDKSVRDAFGEQRCNHSALERHLDPRRTVETGAALPPPPWFRLPTARGGAASA